jgi:DNA-binding response OmpR family regulator
MASILVVGGQPELYVGLVATFLGSEVGVDYIADPSGIGAIKKIIEESITLVIITSDVLKKRGWTFLELLRQETGKVNLAILVIADQEYLEQAKEYFDGHKVRYLIRPLNEQMVLAAVYDLLD